MRKMPASYAHQCFGDAVLKKTSVPSLIQKHIDYYNLGLQGPDLLFYFHPTKTNPINKKGSRMHEEPAKQMFRWFSEEKDERKIVYLLGFICHFTLDAACHPYINQWVKEKGWGHYAIERELDMALIHRHSAAEQRVARCFVNDHEICTKIGEVLGVENVIISQCIDTFKTLNNLIYSSHRDLRRLAIAVIKVLHLGSFGDMFLRDQPDAQMRDEIQFLVSLTAKSVDQAVMLQDNFLSVLAGRGAFDPFFDRNYLQVR